MLNCICGIFLFECFPRQLNDLLTREMFFVFVKEVFESRPPIPPTIVFGIRHKAILERPIRTIAVNRATKLPENLWK